MKQFFTLSKSFAFAAMLLVSSLTNAALVTWEFGGTFEAATGSNGYNVGTAFNTIIEFDTDALLLETRTGVFNFIDYSPGAQYRYDMSSIVITVSIDGLDEQVIRGDTATFGLLWVRDDSGDLFNRNLDDFVSDGISFSLSDDMFSSSLVFRSSILDIFNGEGLPSEFDPRFLDGEVNTFGFSNTQGDGASGRVTSFNQITQVSSPQAFGIISLALLFLANRQLRKPVF